MSCLDETAAVRADALENGATTVACISWPGWLSLFRRESQVARLISRVSVPTPCRLVKILSMAGAPHYSGLRRRRGWRLLVQIARLQTLLLSASDKIVWSACSPHPGLTAASGPWCPLRTSERVEPGLQALSVSGIVSGKAPEIRDRNPDMSLLGGEWVRCMANETRTVRAGLMSSRQRQRSARDYLRAGSTSGAR